MNYQYFYKQLVQSLQEKLGEEYQVKITDIEKNNGVFLEGIIIIKEESQISPNIYLEYFYDRYREGESLEEIIEEILNMYYETMNHSPVQIDQLTELKKHEDNIFFRLINYKMNKRFLDKVPHIRYLEFAITFHCLLEKQEYGIQSFCINETIRQEWGVCLEQLYQFALKNTPILFPPKIQSMEKMMYQIIENPKKGLSSVEKWYPAEETDYQGHYEKTLENMILDIDDSDETYMYVLSNGLGIYGASALLYPNVLEYFAKRSGKNLYLLPSSIHEWIIVLQQEEYSEELLKDMVHDVNHTQVASDEVLSNQVFFYNKDTKRIEGE
ncbi:MAG: hypothetical protein HFJ09_01730 [Lachnospiraceae bacterium]|nr:hypothetical protein [Lachnospiraceae bacterium]